MNAKIKISAILASLVVLFALAATAPAEAQNVSMTAINSTIDNCQKQMVANAQAAQQKKNVIVNASYANMPTINAELYQCLQQIENDIDALGGMAETIQGFFMSESAAANPWPAIGQAAMSVAFSLFGSDLNALCTVAAKDLTNVVDFTDQALLNSLCVPIPNINLGLNLSPIKLQTTTCHGVNVIGPILNAQNPQSQQPGQWDMFGLLKRNN